MNRRDEPNPEIEKTVFPQGLTGMPSAARASELLARLNRRVNEPIDGLLDALCEGTSPARLMRHWVSRHGADAERWQRVIRCEPLEADLGPSKEQAKAGFVARDEGMNREAAILAYLLVVAGGILAHGRVESSVDRETLDEWFSAVAGATPGHPLSVLMTRASERLSEL